MNREMLLTKSLLVNDVWFEWSTSEVLDESLLEWSAMEGDSPVYHWVNDAYGFHLESRVLWDKSANGW